MGMFYSTIIAWAVYYFFLSFSKEVPWQNCGNSWNTDCCLPMKHPDKQFSDYQLSSTGLRYRNMSNKLILYKNEKNTTSFNDLKTLLQLNMNSTIGTNYTSNDDLFDSWLSSYYVLVNNETLLNVPQLSINASMSHAIRFDYGIIIDLIEKGVGELFSNSSYSLILNCSNFIVSPTQEFYSRNLIEIHKSRGLEDIGEIKWEVAACLFLVFVTVYFALWKGIKSAGKVYIEAEMLLILNN